MTEHLESENIEPEIELDLSSTNTGVGHSLKGKATQAQEQLLDFVLLEQNKRSLLKRDEATKAIDLARTMSVIEGFKQQIENKTKQLSTDLADIGFFVFQLLKSISLKVLDPAMHIKNAAAKFLDHKIRELSEDLGDLGFYLNQMVKSIRLDNIDLDDSIRSLKKDYIEKASFEIDTDLGITKLA